MGKSETAVLGGGCFWCIEAVMRRLKGVKSVVSGYAGGETDKPNYEEVGEGKSGHAEVVKIDFDPEKISYEELLEVFEKMHDPTSLNQQGADVGTQYRSIILWTNEKQKEAAEKWKREDKKRVTEIKRLEKFFEAEKYHQDYYEKNSGRGYCRIVIDPKIKKLEEEFGDKLKEGRERKL